MSRVRLYFVGPTLFRMINILRILIKEELKKPGFLNAVVHH